MLYSKIRSLEVKLIKPYTAINSAWIQISNAGESGTLWLEGPRKNVTSFTGLAIYHTTTGVPGLDKVNESYWYEPNQQQVPLNIIADNPSDVYYAIALDKDVKILVDVA